MVNNKKIEYLVSLFFTTGRLMREKTSAKRSIDPASMLKIETLRLIALEKPTMKRIAEYLRVRAPSATSLVDSLVKADMVKRVPSSKDRRIINMQITNKGESYLNKGLRQATVEMSEMFSRLSDRQIDGFIKVLEEIRSAYSK